MSSETIYSFSIAVLRLRICAFFSWSRMTIFRSLSFKTSSSYFDFILISVIISCISFSAEGCVSSSLPDYFN